MRRTDFVQRARCKFALRILRACSLCFSPASRLMRRGTLKKGRFCLMNKLKRFKAKARELARSGTLYGWPPIEFVLRFEEGYSQAYEWLHSQATKDELDQLCRKARERDKPVGPRENVSGVGRVA
jgi:hypothetical protein